jgi:SAM-dependent methyltransferase
VPETVGCNLCGSSASKHLYRLRDYRLRIDHVEWNVVRCRACGLGYVNPRPTPDEIGRYYPADYFERRATHDARYRLLAGHVPGEPGRLLDIGTARGDFPALMRERGWDVAGLERFVGGNPHGIDIHRARFPEECDLPSESFDVVTAWAVFEHLHDPAAAFAECARLLRPGGRLVIQVPNLRSVHGRLSRQEDVPRHLFFFAPPTLRRYAEGNGLSLTRVVHTTELFGGSGRGVLTLAAMRALGRSTSQFFDMYYTPRAQRYRRWWPYAPAWVAAAAVERVLLSDRFVRAARISGQIVVHFEKPAGSERVLEEAA